MRAWSLDRLQHIALPVMTLVVVSFAVYSRYMRASMLDVINSDYIRTARAKGVPEMKVIAAHRPQRADPARDHRDADDRRAARRRDRHGDRLLARRDGLLLRPEARAARPVPVMAYLLVTSVMIIVRQSPGRHPVRLPRSAHPAELTTALRASQSKTVAIRIRFPAEEPPVAELTSYPLTELALSCTGRRPPEPPRLAPFVRRDAEPPAQPVART